MSGGPEDFSEAMIRSLYAEEPEDPVILVTLNADSLDEPIRASSHDGRIARSKRRGVVSRGEIYDFVPFSLTWGGAGAGEPARDSRLELMVRDGDVTAAIRQSEGHPTVTAEMIRLEAPDSVELAMTDARVSEAEIDPPKATATLRQRDFASEPACKKSYNHTNTPGLY